MASATPSSDLAAAALRRVQDPTTGRVRVEDYVTVLAALTGEAALVACGVIDIETTDLTPGAPIFGDPMNQVLTGDTADLDQVPPRSVIGVLMAELVPDPYDRAAFDQLEVIYERVAEGVGERRWGEVHVAVPDDNQPSVLPLQVAFELRPAVDQAVAAVGLPRAERHLPCAQALAEGLRQVQRAIDSATALTLALDVAFTMAKTVPMSRRAFEQVGHEEGV